MPTASRPKRNLSNAALTTHLRVSRFWLICLVFFAWAVLIAGRLFWLQIVHHQEYVERAEKQQQRTFEVAPRRGVLYDRNLRELAMTVQVDSIYAVPIEIKNKADLAHKLAEIVHVDPEDFMTREDQILSRLNAGRSFAWIARRVSAQTSAAVQDLIRRERENGKGIYFQKEFQRFYPNDEIAAQVLGYVGVDDNGLGGLEQKYDAALHGKPGTMLTAVDARRKILGSTAHDPEPGQNLVLTIDKNIQFFAERALDDVMARSQAANGTIVIQDVHSGQILALAVRPSFNPNQRRYSQDDLMRMRNHAVSDPYEPGSTFKLVTYSAALDQRVATPDDVLDCSGGGINVAGNVIHDDKGDRNVGRLTVAQALAKSSDVCAIKLALKIGPERFYQYIHDFGFGQRTGAELPDETRGLLNKLSRWTPSSIGYVAIGQEVAVTPIQLVSMVSAIANGGMYLPPHILMPGQVDRPAGTAAPTPVASPFKPVDELPNPLPAGSHRVISTLAAAQMRKMMEGVVVSGTGRAGQLNGYSAGGKTGTAQKFDRNLHAYSKTEHVASFAGFTPVNNPVIAVAVVMDSPRGNYYGAEVSAPVFAEVAQQVLEYLGVPHDAPLRASRGKQNLPHITEDSAPHTDDIHAIYSAINDLPEDDPLRQSGQQASSASPQPAASPQPSHIAAAPAHAAQPVTTSAHRSTPPSTPQLATVPLSKTRHIRVPSLMGLPMRKVIILAAQSGFEVQITGTGQVREQMPAPGSMVDPGTKIVVRCGR
jgi:cell division protein FtsI (penicillin-binding protein 3)